MLVSGKDSKIGSPFVKGASVNGLILKNSKDGKVIVLVSTSSAMSTKELAEMMRSDPLSCTDAINLDGGSSSQVFAHIDSFLLNVHGFSNVSDAIIVK